jgi:hypothetical protein
MNQKKETAGSSPAQCLTGDEDHRSVHLDQAALRHFGRPSTPGDVSFARAAFE